MATATRTAIINAPIEQVWPVLADFADTYRWNPVVPVSYAVGDRSTGLGARRHCEFNSDGSKWLEEEIIEFDDTDHHYTLQLVDGTEKPPVEDVRVTISADAISSDATEVTMAASLNGRGPVQALIASLGSLALRRVLGQLMAGLERHVSTGEEITNTAQLRRVLHE